MEKQATILVADHHGIAGIAIQRHLQAQGFEKSLSVPRGVPLRDAHKVGEFFEQLKPTYVFLIGGRSGGIRANQIYPAELMLDNILVTCHVMENAHRHGVKKLLYLASSCAYPKFCDQPMKVDSLMTGKLEPTNEAYATAKLAGLVMAQAYRQQFQVNFVSGIPANLFGPGDDFSAENSHVVGALIRRLHEAKRGGFPEVTIWGTGKPRREFIFAADLADACHFLMDCYDDGEAINIGVGQDWSIGELAEMIREVIGYRGRLVFDTTKPDGMPAKLLESSRLRELGWQPKTTILDGLRATYKWYLQQQTQHGAGEGDARTFL